MKTTITSLVFGAILGQYGLTGLQQEDNISSRPEQEVVVSVEQSDHIAMIGAYGPPPGMVVDSRADIGADVEAGVQKLDRSARQLPGYAVKMAEQVKENGIAGLAYTSPEMKKAGHDLGTDIGDGIRHFAIALGKDMVASAAAARQVN